MIKIGSRDEFKASEIPSEPGVYLFKDGEGKILYIGKAKSLRSRVSNYFSKTDHPAKTVMLVSKIRNIDWIVVNNEVEALLLENKLIKQHEPKYNINLKDAKTYAYIALSRDPFPRLFSTRMASAKLEAFGPYTDGFRRQDLQKLMQKIFKIRVCRKLPKKACLNFYIGLCTAPCIGNVSKEAYSVQVEGVRLFLNGNYGETTDRLNREMLSASAEKKYERALELRNQIASIQLLTKKQIVDRERRYDQDVMVFRQLGERMLIVQMGVRRGVLLGKKEFSVDMQPNIEEEFLKAFYTSNIIPNEVLLNKPCWTDFSEKHALEKMFSDRRGALVALMVPERGEKRALVELAQKNMESSLDKNSVLIDMQTQLYLPTHPHLIESFDVSNLGKEHIVAGMVRFRDGKPDKSNYRRYRLKSVLTPDDPASMREIVRRRYLRLSDEKQQMPDLVVVDGGSTQVSAAKSALKSLGIKLPLIGLAKEHEDIYLPDESTPRRFDKNGRMMLLLRQIRDEAHRFAISYNKKRRQMKIRREFKE
jgi:excinuclease ABC subunit C